MNAEVKKIQDMGCSIRLNFDQRDLQNELMYQLRELAKTTVVAGFRKGRAPLKMISDKYANKVKEEIIYNRIRNELPKVLYEHNLEPVMEPLCTSFSFDAGEANFYFEVYPENAQVKIPGQRVPLPKIVIEDDDLDIHLDNLKHRFQKWEIVEKPEQQSRVFRARVRARLFGIDANERQELSHYFEDSEFYIDLDPNLVMPEVLEALLEGKAGDTLRFQSDHPILAKNQPKPSYDKPYEDGYEFEIEVLQVEEALPGEYNDQFHNHFDGLDFDDEEFQLINLALLKHETFHRLWSAAQLRIKNYLLSENEFVVPPLFRTYCLITELGAYGLGIVDIERFIAFFDEHPSLLQAQVQFFRDLRWLVIEQLIDKEIKKSEHGQWENLGYPKHWSFKEEYHDYEIFLDDSREVYLDPSRENTLNCLLGDSERSEVKMSYKEFFQWEAASRPEIPQPEILELINRLNAGFDENELPEEPSLGNPEERAETIAFHRMLRLHAYQDLGVKPKG